MYEVWIDTRNTRGEVVQYVESITATKRGALGRANRINTDTDLYPNHVAWVEYNEAAEETYAPNGRRKLTDAEIDEIRELLALGLKQKDIADKFGITTSMVSYIKAGKRRPGDEPIPSGHGNLTEEIVREARARYKSGTAIRPLAKEYGVRYGTMWKAIQGISWSHVE